MSASKADMRSSRTRRACKQALLELMQETDFQDITVTDVASRADISRVTFYRHYPSIVDVLADISHDVMDEYVTRRREVHYPDTSLKTGVEQRCLLFYSHFAEHADYYAAMFGRHGIPTFERELQDMRVSFFCSRYTFRAARGQSEAAAGLQFKLLANYIVYAQLGLAKYWLMEGRDTDIRVIAEVAADFTYTLISDQSKLVISENER